MGPSLIRLIALRYPRIHDRALVASVMVWWLLVFEVIALTVPAPEIPDTPFALGLLPAFGIPSSGFAPARAPAVVPGQIVHLSVPSEATWLVTTDRVTYDDFQRALLGHEDGVNEVYRRTGWISVLHGQVAQVIDIDRDAVLIELLGDPNVGVRAWMKPNYLGP